MQVTVRRDAWDTLLQLVLSTTRCCPESGTKSSLSSLLICTAGRRILVSSSTKAKAV